MFEGDQKVFLALGAAVIWLAMVASENSGTVAEPETEIATASLPPIPLGIGSDGAPTQAAVAHRTVPLGDGFQAELLYAYRLEGVVVTRQVYRNDPTSAVSPLDLGIVWGELADEAWLAEMSFRTGRRSVSYRADESIAAVVDWETMVTNNHLIPATPEIHAALMAIRPGDEVQISGYLVEVSGSGINPWRSSTRRDDNTIIGGCEIILVRGVHVFGAPSEA